MRNTDHPSQIHQSFLIDIILSEQGLVIAEVAQEPIEFPQGFWCAIEPSRETPPFIFLGFEDDEGEGEERLLRVPAIRGSFNSDQKQSLELDRLVLGLLTETADMPFHECTSGVWEKLWSLAKRPSRSLMAHSAR